MSDHAPPQATLIETMSDDELGMVAKVMSAALDKVVLFPSYRDANRILMAGVFVMASGLLSGSEEEE